MIDHVSFYAIDYEATRSFYDRALAALGYVRSSEFSLDRDPDLPGRRVCGYGREGGRPHFWVVQVPEPATPRHLAFAAPDRAAVDAFHAEALAAGGTDHGPPGPRPIYHPHYYGAFALDPDGNNVEAVCHEPVPTD